MKGLYAFSQLFNQVKQMDKAIRKMLNTLKKQGGSTKVKGMSKGRAEVSAGKQAAKKLKRY